MCVCRGRRSIGEIELNYSGTERNESQGPGPVVNEMRRQREAMVLITGRHRSIWGREPDSMLGLGGGELRPMPVLLCLAAFDAHFS